jgi:hypothetical protein
MNEQVSTIDLIYDAMRSKNLAPLLRTGQSGAKGTLPAFGTKSYIYFLFDNEELVYIGRSRDSLRIKGHREKQYTKWFAVLCGDGCWQRESSLIRCFLPKYNKTQQKH